MPAAQIGVSGPISEIRTHVRLDDRRGTAEDGKLFVTEGLRFDAAPDRQFGIWTEITPSPALHERAAAQRDGIHSLGGEGRLAFWQRTALSPESIKLNARVNIVEGRARLRLLLLTPAHFVDGWKPAWLSFSHSAEAFQGRPPTRSDKNVPELRLCAAAVSRFQTISGWGLAPDQRTGFNKPGPKPVRRLVPAGSVFFVDFAATEAEPEQVARDLWLTSVTDSKADQHDGFGLIMVGTW